MKKGGRTLAGRAKKEGQLVDMVGDLSLSPETPPRRKRIGSKEMTARGAMEKSGVSGLVRERRPEDMNPLNTSFSRGLEKAFDSQRR